jgi:hypothetical protein
VSLRVGLLTTQAPGIVRVRLIKSSGDLTDLPMTVAMVFNCRDVIEPFIVSVTLVNS